MAGECSSSLSSVSDSEHLHPFSKTMAVSFPCEKKVRRNPGVLITWIHTHSSSPYPTKAEKDMLSRLAGMNLRQLNDWFANARRNIKKKGGYTKWREKHPGHSAALTVSEGELSQLYPTPDFRYYPRSAPPTPAGAPTPDFRYYPCSAPPTPAGAPIGFPPLPAGPIGPIRSPCFADNTHLALMNGIGGPVGPLGTPITPPGDPQGVLPLSGGYYQPCIKPLSFPSPTYAPSFPHRLDSTHVTPHSAQPVLMDGGFVHPTPAQRAIKLYPTFHYKRAGTASPAQLSTGSSPYSDTAASPIFGGQLGKIEPLAESPQSSGFVPLHSIKEELPWNLTMESQVPDGARITRTYCTYYSYMPNHAVNSAIDPGGWEIGTADSVWGSPSQATPNSGDTEDSSNAEKEANEAEREETISVSCAVQNSWTIDPDQES